MEALFPWWIAIKLIYCMLFYITPDAFNIDTSLCDNEEHQNCRLLWPFMDFQWITISLIFQRQ